MKNTCFLSIRKHSCWFPAWWHLGLSWFLGLWPCCIWGLCWCLWLLLSWKAMQMTPEAILVSKVHDAPIALLIWVACPTTGVALLPWWRMDPSCCQRHVWVPDSAATGVGAWEVSVLMSVAHVTTGAHVSHVCWHPRVVLGWPHPS